MTTLVHICGADDWAAAQASGAHRPESLAAVGFVHLSTAEQVHLPANRLYAGRDDLVLLWLEPSLLASPVKWEPGTSADPSEMLFPHLYGPLPVTAVTSVTPYRPGPDGTYAPPSAT